MIVLDIETKPNEELRDLFMSSRSTKEMTKTDINKAMACNPDFCEIVCIAIKQVGSDQVRVLQNIEGLSTKEWYQVLEDSPFVTYNGKSFDLPILIKHGLRVGVKLPYERLMNACKKWGYGDRHLDLMEKLSFNGRWESLDVMSQIYLGIKKETVGDDFFEKATKKELVRHCAQDVSMCEDLARKFKLI